MAKQKVKGRAKKRVAGAKATSTHKKRAARKKAAPKTVSSKAATKKTVKKAARKATRKRAKPRAATRARKISKKTVRKTTRKPTSRAPRPTTVPEPTANATLLDAPVKRRSPLKKKDLSQFRELLLIKRAQLVGDVSTLQQQALSENRQEAAGDLSSMPIHMADLGTDNYEKEFTLGLIESERTLLREIDQALGRIDDGTYGICEATGKPIGKARLKAQPWVRYCYEYMLAQEEGRRSSGL